MPSPQDEPPYDPKRTGSWLVCATCGTQFPTSDPKAVTTCKICDDPRQYTPPTGQSFTTLDELRAAGHKNTWHPLPGDEERFISVQTEPKVAIGQRAVLVRTPRGNVLWDCITYIDDETIAKVNELGGLSAIVISHPHYYAAHVEWARAFSCPVYLADEDKEWTVQDSSWQKFWKGTELDVPLTGNNSSLGSQEDAAGPVKILKPGGHFPGSVVVLYDRRLLIADTLVTVASGMGNWETNSLGEARPHSVSSPPRDPPSRRPAGMTTFSFMWSIPNMIPLAPDVIEHMWDVLKGHEYHSTHGPFVDMEINGSVAEMRRRVLESMQIQIRFMGYGEHRMLSEK